MSSDDVMTSGKITFEEVQNPVGTVALLLMSLPLGLGIWIYAFLALAASL